MKYISVSRRPTESIENSHVLLDLYDECVRRGELGTWRVRAETEMESLKSFANDGRRRLAQTSDPEHRSHINQLISQLEASSRALQERIHPDEEQKRREEQARQLEEYRARQMRMEWERAREAAAIESDWSKRRTTPASEQIVTSTASQSTITRNRVDNHLVSSSNSYQAGRFVSNLLSWVKGAAGLVILGFLLYSCLAPKTYSPPSTQNVIPTQVSFASGSSSSGLPCSSEDLAYLDKQHRIIDEINRLNPLIDDELNRAFNNVYLVRSDSWRRYITSLLGQYQSQIDEFRLLIPSPAFMRGHTAQLDDLIKASNSANKFYIALNSPDENRINDAKASAAEWEISSERVKATTKDEYCMTYSSK